MVDQGIRDETAVADGGESAYHKYGRVPYPESFLARQAFFAADRHAGKDLRNLDEFFGVSNPRDTTVRVSTAPGVHAIFKHNRELTLVQWKIT